MRKITVLLILGLFFSACAWMAQNIESTEVIAKIAARNIGSELQFKQPDVAEDIYKVCKSILKDIKTEESEVLKYYIHKILHQSISDPILAVDLIDLLELIKIEPNISLTEDQILIIKTIADGFISGIELSGGGNYEYR